jgi:hypothetical protein
MAAGRDPTIEPLSGDVLENGEIEWRVFGYIECLERIEVSEFRGGEFVRNLWPLPDVFRKWARNAIQLHRSEELENHDLRPIEAVTRLSEIR